MGNIKPIDISFFTAFNEELCNGCGECFHKCPVMHLPLDVAIEEMKKLITGEKTKKVLNECQSCFSCNFYCPKNAHPASLILKRWNEQYKRTGLRKRGKHYMTLYPHYPNFRSYVMERLPKNTKEIVREGGEID